MKIMLVAGEISGDVHGGMLADSLKELNPDVRMFGIGGHRMKQAGVDIKFDVTKYASIGIWENARNYLFTMRKVFNQTKKFLEEEDPSCVVLIDYQGFNIELAKVAKKKGIRIVYYVPPQYWAWNTGKAKYVAKLVDAIIAILKQEEEAYSKVGANVTFVGNPLLDTVKVYHSKEEIYKIYDLDPYSPVVALLPGSRFSEIRSLLPDMLKAAKIIREEISDVQFVLPVAAKHLTEKIEEIEKKINSGARIIQGHSYEILTICNVGIICSGLATMEASILGAPMVVAYKVSFLTELIARMVLKLKDVSPPNILAGRRIVPELLQSKANPQNIANEVLTLLRDKKKIKEMKASLHEAVLNLGHEGASRRAAAIVLKVAGSIP